MLVVATVMLTRKHPTEDAPVHVPSLPREILAGLGVGFLTGFLGVGGGFLIVPALVLFGGLAMKDAIGTSLFVIAVNCAAGILGHLSEGDADWRLTGSMVAVLAVAGASAGTALSHRFHPRHLQRISRGSWWRSRFFSSRAITMRCSRAEDMYSNSSISAASRRPPT